MSLSDYVREMRKRKDWSQRDLATASGISNAEISRIESGKRKSPSPSVLKALAKAMNVPVAEMYKEAGIIEDGQHMVEEALEKIGDTPISEIVPSGIATTDKYSLPHDLSDEELREIMQYVDYLISKRK